MTGKQCYSIIKTKIGLNMVYFLSKIRTGPNNIFILAITGDVLYSKAQQCGNSATCGLILPPVDCFLLPASRS